MKVTRTGLAVLLIAGMAQAASAFEIKAYSPSKGTVEIQSGSEYTNRPFSSFSAAEQQQITGWLADKEFQSTFGLSISAEQKKKTNKISAFLDPSQKLEDGGLEMTFTEGEVSSVSYVIKLENLSQVEFHNLVMEYRIFYEIQKGSEKTKKCVRRTAVREKLLP